MIAIRHQYCTNSKCSQYKRKTAGNVIIHSKRHRRLKCKHCGKTWVEHIHQNHYNLKTNKHKLKRALNLLENGISIRKTAVYVEVSPGTIQRWKNRYINPKP